MKKILLLALVLAPSIARATGSAVYDGGPVAIPKSDYQVTPAIPSNQKIVAADWNQAGQYILDAATAIKWGYFHGLAPQTAAPPAPDSGIILFNMLDGGGFWVEFPDAGTQQVVLTLAGVATIPSIDAGSILTGTLTTGAETVNGTGSATFEYTAPHIVATTDLASSATMESSGKATLDTLYVPGAVATFDGGVDLGVLGEARSAKKITSSSTLAFNNTTGATATPWAFDTPGTTHTSGFLFTISNNTLAELTLSPSGLLGATGGFDFNSQKGLNVLAGTASTDAVDLLQIEAKSLAGSNPVAGYAHAVPFAAQKSKAAATALRVTFVTLTPGANGAGGTCSTTLGIFDETASHTALCSKTMAVGAANTDTNAGSTEVVDCTALTIAAGDVIGAEVTSSTCNQVDGTYSANASWW